MPRLFTAIKVPVKGLKEHAERLPGKTDRTPPHITVEFFGDTDQEKIIEGLEKLDHRRFKVKIEGLGGFPSDQEAEIIYASVDSPGIRELREKSERLTPPSHSKQYVPHVTLTRTDEKVDTTELESRAFGGFTAEELVLFDSEKGYREVAKWKL